MDRRTREAIRYLGYGKHAVDEKIMALIGDAYEELDSVARKRIVYRIFNLRVSGDNCIIIEDLKIDSKNLCKNVNGCEQVLILGATLGVEVDRLLQRYAVDDMARVVVLQACASALLEEYLDTWQQDQAQKLQKEGLYMRPRFSPGYGDFSIRFQQPILDRLDAPRKIGLTLTEGGMLTPTKSVTALIGLGRDETSCPPDGCEVCEKTDCAYRRDT